MKENEIDYYKIASEYGAVMEKKVPLFHPLSTLPYRKSEIKTAIKSVIKDIDDEDVIEQLKIGYMLLSNFIPDIEAEKLNAAWEDIKSTEGMDQSEKRKYLRELNPNILEEISKIHSKISEESKVLSEEIEEYIEINKR